MTRSRRHTSLLALAVVAAILGAGAVGYIAGRSHHDPAFKVGTGIVYVTPSEGTAYYGTTPAETQNPNGFAYRLPPGVAWIDSEGTFHDGGAPSCMPFYRTSRVTMGTVKFPLPGGSTIGTVLWVRC